MGCSGRETRPLQPVVYTENCGCLAGEHSSPYDVAVNFI